MNFRGGFSIAQGEEIHLESSWMPATPEKPPILMRSNSVLENPNENQVLDLANSLEPAPNYNFLAQTFNTNPQVGRLPVRFGYDGNPNINGIAGSYEQHSLLDESEDWNNISFMQLLQQGGNSDLVASTNRTLSKDVQVSAEQPLMPTLPPEMSNFRRDCSSSDGFNSESSFRPEIASARCQVGKSWIGSSPAGVLLREGTQCSASDPADNDAFRIPSRPSYDSNSSLSINCDALTNAANSLVFTPVTPDQAANLEKQSSAVLMSTVVESTSQEKDRLGNLVQYTGKEANQQHGEELLQNIGDSSSTTISTAQKELTDSDKKIDLGIDLNKTPQQKPPKRKKHRPKVIVEGKPRRARKPAQAKNTPSGENLPEKRKYVRKNARKDLTAQEVDITRETRDPGIGTGQKTCKRVLNFDLEKTGNETHNNVAAQQEVQNMNMGTKSIIGDYQAMERLNGTNHALGTSQVQSGLPKSFMVENQIPGKMDSGAHFMSQMSPDGLAIVAPLASTQDMRSKHFYVTGKTEINSNADQWKNRTADKYALMQQETDGEGAGQDGLQGKADNGNLDRAKQMINLETIKLMIQQQTHGKGAGQNGLQVKADKGNLERAKQMMNLERIKLMTQQQTHGEGAGQDGLQVKADKENLERAKQMMNLERIKLMTQQQTHGLQLKADKGNLEMAKQMMNRERIKLMMQQQTHGEGAGQEGLQGKANNGNLERAKQMINLERIKLMMQIMPQQASMTPSKFYEARGSKREHSQTTEHANQSTTNHVGSSLYDETFQVDECQRNGHTLLTEFPQTHKKNKIGGDYIDIQNTPSSGKGADGGLGKAEIKRAHDAYPIGQTSRLNCTTLNSYLESSRVMDRENKQGNKFTNDRYVYPMASGQNSLNQKISSRIHSHIERTSSTRGLNPVKSFSAQATIENCNHRIHIPSLKERSTRPGIGQTFQTCYNSMSEKRQTVGGPLLKSASLRAEKLQEPSPKRRGPKTKQIPISMDEILYRLQRLNLNGSSNGLQKQDQNALVLYKGDGAVVPYDGLEFLKKRKPRPKVDLDPETNRIWNLLMGKEGSEDLGGTDKEKEKRWEEERKVFRGRVDSFIARMHLVQGDRRFSPWKGSVVDSVIGVFLTQNVSDHLSSSAFMSLAARFPIKFRSYRAQDKAETNMIDRQAPISMLNPDDTYKWREELSEPINNPNIRPHESTENQWESDNRGTKRSLIEAQSQSSDEEFMLSQDSFDSTITQVTGGIRSCSGSNSETEDPCTSCKPSNIQLSSSTHYLQLEKMTSVQKVFSHVNGCTILNEKSKHGLVEYGQLKSRSDAMKHLDFPSSNPDYPYMQQAGHSESNKLHIINDSRVPQIWCYETLSEESTSSWHSTASRSAKGLEAVSKSSRTGESAGNFGISTNKLNGECRSQETLTADPYALLSMFLTNEQGNGIPQTVPHIGHNHQTASSSYQPERNNIFHLEGTSSTEPVQLAEAHTKMQNATMESIPNFNNLTEKTFEAGDSISAVRMQMHKENGLAEPNLKKQTSSNYASEAANTKMSKAKKGNSESQKKNEVNWDKLRKKVESDGKKRERGNDAMDSIDYEAVRNANVNEISDAIKERGMNNMLAERIQEFLKRLVREHGSIDLEWLRDVPPDQAKDYLLSIRGIGLKSVECVRLLTLHHLAFPVDTNVGRIAVRLGWVPLQPLPESLQLHLLELYPMLESIQKYLWPRLCKLDQRTLYELHYQMITFGKVFCTKREPNCNACPMRGECRHFASAFASARLALPGPEERGIVGSTVPIPTEKRPTVVIHPMTLPLPENDLVKEGGSKTGNCEPIIEEPATPELECTEISQSDIEDAFYEDPDEIPTIKLNMEEFTENLQTYMQKNMELQEGDMSKALVALTPDVASIPIPKLKNVSRLRTEHQVYELPDSHPLLERLDRREPDDPSPYLLAIWTPGETANSILPSERSCGSQEPGKLCNDETCFSCNSMREANSRTVRGTILIPCRTAMRGSFPLNGTYFQVNEVFADHDSSLNPIDVPREWIWNLPRRTVYFGTSVTTIFKGLSTEGIQYCFWKGFVCVRGFDLTTRAPRPLMARLHFPASKLAKAKHDDKR